MNTSAAGRRRHRFSLGIMVMVCVSGSIVWLAFRGSRSTTIRQSAPRLVIPLEHADCVRLGDRIDETLKGCPRLSFRRQEFVIEDVYSARVNTYDSHRDAIDLGAWLSIAIHDGRVGRLSLDGRANRATVASLAIATAAQFGEAQKLELEGWLARQDTQPWKCIVPGAHCLISIRWEDQDQPAFLISIEAMP